MELRKIDIWKGCLLTIAVAAFVFAVLASIAVVAYWWFNKVPGH